MTMPLMLPHFFSSLNGQFEQCAAVPNGSSPLHVQLRDPCRCSRNPLSPCCDMLSGGHRTSVGGRRSHRVLLSTATDSSYWQTCTICELWDRRTPSCDSFILSSDEHEKNPIRAPRAPTPEGRRDYVIAMRPDVVVSAEIVVIFRGCCRNFCGNCRRF